MTSFYLGARRSADGKIASCGPLQVLATAKILRDPLGSNPTPGTVLSAAAWGNSKVGEGVTAHHDRDCKEPSAMLNRDDTRIAHVVRQVRPLPALSICRTPGDVGRKCAVRPAEPAPTRLGHGAASQDTLTYQSEAGAEGPELRSSVNTPKASASERTSHTRAVYLGTASLADFTNHHPDCEMATDPDSDFCECDELYSEQTKGGSDDKRED